MTIIKEHSFKLTLLFSLLASQLTGCASEPQEPKEVFAADLQVRIDNVNTVTRLWANQGKLRVALPAGQSASTMLADYNTGTCWALFPAMETYQEIPASTLRTDIPHLFDPNLNLEKQLIGHELLNGQMTRIYKVVAHSPLGKVWDGTLWEAVNLEGYPLKWRDAHRDIEADWINATLVKVPENFFSIPDSFRPRENVPAPDRSSIPGSIESTSLTGLTYSYAQYKRPQVKAARNDKIRDLPAAVFTNWRFYLPGL